LKKNESPEQVRRAAEAIERNVRLQSRMVEDLLDMNRIVHGTVRLDLEVHELPALIRAAAEANAHDIEKKAIRLEWADAGEPLGVEGDAGRLQQVFANIISNAVKFTPAEGRIRVTLGREAGSARVVVADTGAGIAPEFLPFVFDIFRQQEQGIRREHEGLGIGLALVKWLTELHKGTVSVVSAGVGRGTEVTVLLPLAAETPALDVEDAAAAGAEAGTASLSGLSVLVVEDSDDAREMLRDLLNLLGAQATAARDGREALEMMRDAVPDLVLCDLRMPRMDGFEFIRELHHRPSASPPVVAVSAFASAADRARTREAGFAAHIAKPFDETDLIAAVGAALAHRH
jgi:CheY-like chemotaxis protein